jgi:hypothetical protein
MRSPVPNAGVEASEPGNRRRHMATYRRELEPHMGNWVEIEADVSSRSSCAMSAGKSYGFLLQDISVLGGEKGDTLDHAWLGIYDLDLCQANSERIRCEALVSEYYSEGAERHGGSAIGIGFSEIRNVRVLAGGEGEEEVSLADYAKAARKRARERIKTQKAAGTYVWPGVWAFCGGDWKVKAAKTAAPGSPCDVMTKSGTNDRKVLLVSQVPGSPGFWDYEEAQWCKECESWSRVSARCQHLSAAAAA